MLYGARPKGYVWDNLHLVAEVKTQSPFGFKSEKSWDELLELAIQVGDIVSIHVDPRWGGSPDLIDKAFAKTSQYNRPILAKGLTSKFDDVHEYIRRGASYVLVIDQDLLDKFEPTVCWYEFDNDTYFIRQTSFKKEHVYVVNSRSTHTGKQNDDNWSYIRRLHHGILVQASGVRTIHDVKTSANTVIVGQYLPEFAASLKPFIQ